MSAAIASAPMGGSLKAMAVWIMLVVFGQIFGAVAGCSVTGCSQFGQGASFVDSINDPKDDKDLHDCRVAGLNSRDAGASKEDAYKTYTDCTKEKGLR